MRAASLPDKMSHMRIRSNCGQTAEFDSDNGPGPWSTAQGVERTGGEEKTKGKRGRNKERLIGTPQAGSYGLCGTDLMDGPYVWPID
jgi:hypothetical protein